MELNELDDSPDSIDTRSATVDHSYFTVNDIDTLKRKYDELTEKHSSMRQQLQNAKRREKRSKQTLDAMLEKMKEMRAMSEEAHCMLESYKGMYILIETLFSHNYYTLILNSS